MTDSNISDVSLILNVTHPWVEPPIDGTMRRLHSVFGCIAVALNIITISYIARLHNKHATSFNIQMVFVCINDIGCAFAIFLRAVISVTDNLSAFVCALALVLTMGFDTVSKGNMFCICLQRYIFARHINTTVPSWRRSYTMIMSAANGLCGVAVAAAVMSMFDITQHTYARHNCNVRTIRNHSRANTFGVLFFVQLLILIASDIVCTLTIWTLRRADKTIHPNLDLTPRPDSGTSDTSVKQTTQARTCSQRRQRHAIITVLIILIVFNISYVPIMATTVYNMLGHILKKTVYDICILVAIVPSFVNPALIATRIQDIRSMIWDDVVKIKHAFSRRPDNVYN